MTRDPNGTPQDGDVDAARRAESDPDADAVLADAAAAADEDALADAGLPQEGHPETVRRPQRKAGLGHRLYNGEAGFDVVGHSKLIYKITAVVVLLCIASMVFRGFNFGIDFAGGNSFKLPGSTEQLTEVRQAAEDTGAEVATAQVVGSGTILIRTEALDNDGEQAVREATADVVGISP